ncbi:MAG TPA: cell division protein ZapB [Treponema sp.]|nr:cell division protein ZapB [Treponema sp.]
MLTLEQVKLLETKVANTIEYMQRLTAENTALRTKLEVNQRRIDELEVLVTRFKEEQGRIEDGILAALDRLNQFEDAVEKTLALRSAEVESAGEKADKPSSPELPEEEIPAEEEPDSESGELDIF